MLLEHSYQGGGLSIFGELLTCGELWNNSSLILWPFASETQIETFVSSTFTSYQIFLSSVSSAVMDKSYIWKFPLYHKAVPGLLFFWQFSWAQFTQIQSGTNQKKLKTQFHGLWNIPLNMFYVLVWNHSESFSHRCSAVLSLKQLIHSSITKAEGLIEMFSHFSLPRRRIVNHSSVVYFEISFGVWARAALFFTETSQSSWLVYFFFFRLPTVLLH